MQAQVLKENLSRGVGLVNKFTANKAQLPVLSQIGIRVEKEGIVLMATSLDMGIKLRVGGKILKEGEIAVPGKVLNELMSNLPLGTVEILSETKDQMKVKIGKVSATIQGMGMEEMPGMSEEKGKSIGKISTSSLKRVMRRLGFSVSNDDSRPVLTGVLWEIEKGRLVATDGYRLSMVEDKELKIKEEGGVARLLVPGSFLSEVVGVWEEMGEGEMDIKYIESKKQIVFKGEEVVVFGRVLEGEFPHFEAILLKGSVYEARLDREEWLRAVKTALVFARDSANVVKCSVSEGKMIISANAPQVGENQIEVAIDGGKEALGAMAFNGRYLIDFLSHCEEEKVTFKFQEPLKPGMFYENEKEDFVHVIMPVRTKE